MARWLKIGGGLLAVAGLALGLALLARSRSAAGVEVMVRVTVAPGERAGAVVERANSAQFRYLMGKEAGVPASLAQKLTVRAVPNTAVVEGRLTVPNRDQAERYANSFRDILQELCGKDAVIKLLDRTIR